MIINIIAALANVCIKLLAAFLAYSLAGWLQVPEWAVLCLVIMAVQSTYLKASRS